MTRYVALLRAINTAPRFVKMARLREVFEGLGFGEVSTFIASGNVIFTSDDPDPVPRIEAALAEALGFEVPVFLRTDREIAAVAAGAPFEEGGEIEVSFLPSRPDPAAARALESGAGGADRLAVVDREVYWLRLGTRAESTHAETEVVRLLGMPTTRRSLRTVQGIAERLR